MYSMQYFHNPVLSVLLHMHNVQCNVLYIIHNRKFYIQIQDSRFYCCLIYLVTRGFRLIVFRKINVISRF